MSTRTAQKPAPESGFTLIELIVVITIIGILAGIAVVEVKNFAQKARESALMDDLYQMRKAIDNFYADKQRYPADLNELVPKYLRKVPADPITKKVDWETVPADNQSTDPNGGAPPGDIPTDATTTAGPGISDVKSKAPGKTLDGKPYSEL